MKPKPRKILFVCIGNACRSQMAEGFARAYGRGWVHAESAGLAPLGRVPGDTVRAMQEKNIDLAEHTSKPVDPSRLTEFDVIVNMSGIPWPWPTYGRLQTWEVPDPYQESFESYRQVRDQLEFAVQRLLNSLKNGPTGKPGLSS